MKKTGIDIVLKYQDEELKRINDFNAKSVDKCIADSESLLRELGYSLPTRQITDSNKNVIVLPEWDALVSEAIEAVGDVNGIEDLFNSDELIENSLAVRAINHDFKQIYKLDKFDYAISICCGLLAAATDVLFVGIPGPGPEGTEAGSLSNWIRDRFHDMIPAEKVAELESMKPAKVPFDAQDNRHTNKSVEGLSSYYHRLYELGHDPLLGFVVGVYDIMHGSMTTVDKNGIFQSQIMDHYSDRIAKDLFEAISKEFLHLMSDVNTSMGLPAPLMGLFDFLQFGEIGEEKLNVAEIVRGMYYQGYDFIHFCSMSVPVMLVEVLTRICYTIKRIKEGTPLNDAIAISTDRKKNPKLGTMMFISHSVATAANAGKVYLSKRPEAINYPQWVAFAINSYKQLKWAMIDKPALANDYFTEKIYEELSDVYNKIDSFIEKNYIIKQND